MAKALFITTTDIKRFTPMDGNLDADKFIQFIDIAQEIHIQQILGTDLMEKLQSDISGATLTGTYATLVETYIKPCLCYYALYEYLPFAPYTISNKGVFKHTSESAINPDPDEISSLQDAAKNKANYYHKRLVDYLCLIDFTEYNTNTEGDVYPDNDTTTSNWFLED